MWKPDDGQTYWTVSLDFGELKVLKQRYEGCDCDRETMKRGNCFRTRSEAWTALRGIRANLTGGCTPDFRS